MKKREMAKRIAVLEWEMRRTMHIFCDLQRRMSRVEEENDIYNGESEEDDMTVAFTEERPS